MKVLFVGDIVGSPGRRAFAWVVSRMRQAGAVDFVIVNAENAAGGRGVTCGVADELLAALISGLQSDETAVSHQTSISADLEELSDQLEALGWVAPAGETTLPAGGGAGDQNLSRSAGNRQRGLWALKQLIIGIQANDNMPSNDMSAGWERLRLFISNALGGETTAQSGGDSKGELNLNQAAGNAQLAHGAQEIALSQESLKSVSGALTGEGSGSEKTDEAKLHPDNRTAADQTSNPAKANAALTDDSGSKVVKIEAGTNDSGQLTSQTYVLSATTNGL